MKNFLLLTLSLLLSVGLAQARNTPTDTVQMYTQGSAPGSPLAGSVYTYFLTSDGFPYWKNSSGNVFGYLYSANALTQYGLLVGDGTRSPSVLGVGTNNTVLVGNTGGNPSFRQILNADVDAATDIDATKIQEANGASNGGVLTTAAQDIGGEKRFIDAVGMKHVSTPANPSAGHMKVYCKSDDKCYKLNSSGDESELGAGGGGGSGGINFITLDSSFLPNKQESSNFENTIGEFTAFADTASATPTDLTGGSPTVTCTRTTSTPLNGAGSLLVTKDAADRQGEGCSAPFYVPPGYRGKQAEIMFPISISGSVVAGDFQVYVYDVTNSQLITPFNKELLGNQIHASFDIPATMVQGRLGFYFASTSTSAVTAKIDDIFAGFKDATYGFAGGGGVDETSLFSVVGLGTISNNKFYTRRVGDHACVDFYFKAGTATATTAYIQLPSKYQIDSSFYASTTNAKSFGSGFRVNVSSATNTSTVALFYDGSTTDKLFFSGADGGSGAFAKINGNSISNNNDGWSWSNVCFKVAGQDSGVTMAESSSRWISSVLANGTRVTSTPTALGQWRTYTKGSSAVSGSDNAPSTSPSATDGMRIYCVNYATGGTSGQPNRWEFFIGKGRNPQSVVAGLQPYSSTGRTGTVDVNKYANATEWSGLSVGYDPTTGVMIVDAMDMDSTVTTRTCGRTIPVNGGGRSAVTDLYFDVLIAENALAVGYQSPRSESFFYVGNGHGSTNTKIRNFTNVVNVGTAITGAVSATLGASFTINEPGIFEFVCTDARVAGSEDVGFSVNSSQLTTNVASITQAYPGSLSGRMVYCEIPAADRAVNCSSGPWYLPAGAVVRWHTNSNPDETTLASCKATKVSH